MMRMFGLPTRCSTALIIVGLGTLLVLGTTALAQVPTLSAPSPDARTVGVAREPTGQEVEEQRSFRANSGLRSDEEYIRALASDPVHRAQDDEETWGMPLAPDELAELNRRVAIGSATPMIKEYARSQMPPDLFAGLWQEQRNGGRIVVALTRPAPDHEQAIRELFPFPHDLAFVVREVQLDQLSAVYDRAVALMGPPGLPLGDGLVNGVAVDEIVGTVVLTVPAEVSIPEVRLRFPETFVHIVVGEHRPGIRQSRTDARAALTAPPGPLVDIPTNVSGGVRDAYGAGRLHGDPSTGCLWLEWDGASFHVVWPKDYTARLEPVELISESGEVVAREGDFIEGSIGAAFGSDIPECGVEFEGVMVMGRVGTVNGARLVHPEP